MSYYEERLKVAEEIASLTAQGFMKKVRDIAEALSICPKDDIKQISEHLSRAVEAMEQAEKDVAYLKDKIREEKGDSYELLSM